MKESPVMKGLRCLVVDDEPLATDVVVGFLQRLDIQFITRCENGIDAFRQLQEASFDLVFLDIEMPQLSGFDLLKSLPSRPKVIVTTAYRDYAVEGFEWEVLDYLVKPFSFARFLQAMEKVTRAGERGDAAGLPASGGVMGAARGGTAEAVSGVMAEAAGGGTGLEEGEVAVEEERPVDGKGFLFLKADRQWIRVDNDAILYIESLKDYIRVVTTAKQYICRQTLADITERLPGDKFFRVHRSFTVAMDKIDRVRHHAASIGGKAIPISRNNRKEVYRRIGETGQ